MNSHYLALSSLITLFFFLTLLPPSYCDAVKYFAECSRPFDCGGIKNISYPFLGDDRPEFCGIPEFKLRCSGNEYPIISFKELDFRVLDINQSHYIMTIARSDLLNSPCPSKFVNTTLDFNNFDYHTTDQNLTLFYDCPFRVSGLDAAKNFTCSSVGDGAADNTYNYFVTESFPSIDELFKKCQSNIRVPVLEAALINESLGLQKVLNQGFDVDYHNSWASSCLWCGVSAGICGSNSSSHKFACLCRDGEQPLICSSKHEPKSIKIVAGLVALGLGVLLTCITICCLRSKRSTTSTPFFMKKTKNEHDLEAFVRNYGPLSLNRYKFSDVKKFTNSFKVKLGQGGYGGVYKGKLLNGRLVAVKVLNASKGNGDEFINEVASISRTSHVNIVTLLGFFLEGKKRALIYEFMPNGSLEKFIHSDNMETTSMPLGLEKLFQIAIGIARGLEYLHRGCNTRILHFDIKPHNILLDENFSPKISDFGLAKLSPRNESNVSMAVARGTIGYIAPEVFNRNFGAVSHKSDVYSYGMMILEMVGGRKNIDVGISNTSEIYFPHWIYKRLEQHNDLGFPINMTVEETAMVRKMILVGLWCIQTNLSDRPSMSKVIEMLEGNIEALQIPPKPFLSSPPRSPVEESSTY
ncbi:LEAF RUST 10 DISEASE-RESISTANCE LOCUS RECEPTOR-LIKE PROTEIN KINASE-like 2.1 isoform X1 [Castanea sativa]|uniref:LEAF RUST 10 DISEASE-RESISTANCE LOCUS RECEPTOR-LIKE PROTEIN KINASE-like 2.1 isoform X1 n=1 Tax=Castanea sativa TaxID=21020 RepID=UPI003F64B2BB